MCLEATVRLGVVQRLTALSLIVHSDSWACLG
jgi:hypothetical protein